VIQPYIIEETTMNTTLNSKGFSLIELLIVVVIVSILAAVAIPAYYNHILRSRQADAYHNLLDIKAAQEMHYSMYNYYAGTITAGTFSSLLSFDLDDSTYYAFSFQTAPGTTVYEARALGKYRKLAGNELWIGADYDPCVVPNSGSLKQSLGLEDCPP
jgi:type IV pilus assembly protein PilE